MLKATMDETILQPDEAQTFILASPPCLAFIGQKIVNLGDDGLTITQLFVGQSRQLLREIPLATMGCSLENCHDGLSVMVRIRNDAQEPRRVSFEIQGRTIKPNDIWAYGYTI